MVIVALFYTFQNKFINQNTGVQEGGKFEPDPSNSTFIFDDSKVTLSNGRGEEKSEDEIPFETILLKERASGDLNMDDKNDTVVLLTRSGGGSGTFIYIAAYVSGPISYKGTNAVFIGDRISPRLVTIEDGVATMKYLDRRDDEPFAAEPTVPVSKQFVYKNGEFVER